MRPFDLKKAVKTREGLPARILATDIAGDFPIAVAVTSPNGNEYISSRTADGRFYRGGIENPYDLVNVPEETSKFCAVYKNTIGSFETSFEKSRSNGRKYTNSASPFLGVLELKFEDGVFVGAVFHKEK